VGKIGLVKKETLPPGERRKKNESVIKKEKGRERRGGMGENGRFVLPGGRSRMNPLPRNSGMCKKPEEEIEWREAERTPKINGGSWQRSNFSQDWAERKSKDWRVKIREGTTTHRSTKITFYPGRRSDQ